MASKVTVSTETENDAKIHNKLRELEEAHRKNQTVREVTDVEWDIRNLEWERERQAWIRQMEENSVWAMGSSPYAAQIQGKNRPETGQQLDITNEELTKEDLKQLVTRRNIFGLDPILLRGTHSPHTTPMPKSSKTTTATAQATTDTHKTSKTTGITLQTTLTQHKASKTSGVTLQTTSEQYKSTKHGTVQKTVHPTTSGQATTVQSSAKTRRGVVVAKASSAIAPQKGRSHAKMKKLSRLELLKFFSEWDKASFGRRDMILIEFIKCYKTKDNVYCSDQLFHCGGSLIFGRFVVSMQMCFLKHRRVWHYFDALAVFVKSLQGDQYSEQFLRLGGLGFICEVIRVEISDSADKLHACKFLVHLMRGRNSIAVKLFICDNPHFLESLIDSLTMCKDKKLVSCCGLCFENLCIEATIPNVVTITSYVMRLLPCDFNPAIQSMAFRVLQSVIRLKPSIGAKCVKPILDNLKTDDMDLLVEMSNLSLVILQTKSGPDLINQLMSVAEGIQLREQFKSVFRPHMRKGRHQPTKDQANELRKAREKHERVRQKLVRFDHYMQQAGALFVLNRMMTDKIDFVTEFTRQGIFGLSLKTLGSCPHWEVQGQGVTMVQFLHAMSIECAISYSLMLPEKMLNLILNRPAECLRYFTSPICILLRKLGRFALRLWGHWVEKVIAPAKTITEGGVLPDYFFEMCKMTRKVNEIQHTIQDLLDHPVMESYSKSSETHMVTTTTGDFTTREPTDEEILKEFMTEDEEDITVYRSGKDLLFEGRDYQPFSQFLDFQMTLSEDKLDMKVDKSQSSILLSDSSKKETELGAYEQILLQDAGMEKMKATAGENMGGTVPAGPVITSNSTDTLEKEGTENPANPSATPSATEATT